ncbi:E3 ubiquitin-protein ligase TRIM45-like [Sycon ciliatum]|uniref:E3 ubiquitin-protein ligase TRIM45-like n=1 Tax=Sycon ciliatum TaxID=27933 RepID=UPI0031F64514
MPRSDCVCCRSTCSGTRGKLLKCLHSICLECLEKHTDDDSSVGCPDCGAITPPPPVAGVPLLQYLPDSDVLSSDAGEATATVQTEKLCDECAEDAAAVAVCMDCGDNLCTGHAKMHPTSRKSYKHNVVSFSEAVSSTPDALRLTSAKCPLHPSSEQSHFCMVCRKILCDKCLASSRHDQHRQDLLPVEQAVSTIRDSLIAKISLSFSGEESQLEDALVATDKALSQLHDQSEALSSQVNDFFTQLKKVIDKRQRQLLDELDQLQLPQCVQLQERKERILSSLSTGQRVKHLTEYGQSDRNFLKMCDWLEDATHDVMDAAEAEVKPFQPVTLQFMTDDNEESNTAISKAGSVSVAVSSDKSAVTIPADVDEGQDLRISIDLRNGRGDTLTATDKRLNSVKVEVMTRENDVTICPVIKVTDAETSSSPVAAVFKTAGKKGQVKVSVTTDAGHIRGSPAVVTVADVLRFDTDACNTGLALSNNGRTVKNPGMQRNASVYGLGRWSTGKYDISIRLDIVGPASSNYLLGMCNEKEPDLKGWYRRYAWERSGTKSGSLGQPWRSGDVIHMSLDCDNQTLVARHDRTGAVDTKTDVTGEIYLYFCTYCAGDQITIL